jgi:phosphoribosylformimino-5-aminoimidazole carboxamide ribotide isomerase
MKVIPAIDLLDGKVVRLRKGDYRDVTVYEEDPAAIAANWRRDVDQLHVVDLEGARTGDTTQAALVARIVDAFGAGVQVGGGIRSLAAVERYLDVGVGKVVLGTAAIRDPAFVSEALQRYPQRVILAVDARNGWVATDGWQDTSGVRASDVVRQFAQAGIAAVLYTDIDRDGTGVGPNVSATAELAREGGAPVIASGGVGSLDHIRALAGAGAGIVGAIVGRALHDKRFTLAEAVAAAAQPS